MPSTLQEIVPLNLLHQEVSSCLIVDCEKLKENIETLRKMLPRKVRLMAMIKAFGYGQDDQKLSKILCNLGIDIFGVAYPEEGIKLRLNGIKEDIFVIHALAKQADMIIEGDLQAAVSTFEFIEALEKEAEKKATRAKVHLHVNTGMTRFGTKKEQALIIAKRISSSSLLTLEGLMTHLASADDEEQDPFTHTQMKTLEAVSTTLKESGIEIPWIHAANSAGVLRHASKHFNMVRVGLSLFGALNKLGMKAEVKLAPAVSLISKIVHIHECSQGETVSYNRDYTVRRPYERIAVVSIGYHDGVPRSMSGKGYALVHGKQAPYVGKICMDYMMIDVTEISQADEGDEVLLFGVRKKDFIPLEVFSSWAETIPHEILCSLSLRVKRIYLNEEKHAT